MGRALGGGAGGALRYRRMSLNADFWVAFASLALAVMVAILGGAMFLVSRINDVREAGRRELGAAVAEQNRQNQNTRELGRRELDAVAADQNKQRHDTNDRVSEVIGECEERITDLIQAARRESTDDHNSLRAQVMDIAGSIRDHYIRRADFDASTAQVTAALTIVQKEIGDLRNNIMDLATKRGA
jgi:hypothetical protein